MALMRIKLTNGDTTIDLFAGAIQLMEGGLDIGNPTPDPKYISSPMADGDLLSSIRYGNRTITLNLKASGTTLADLKTNIRAIERILTDAKEYSKATYIKHGTLTASGKCTLELQWGDTASLSTFFEVVQGQLKMPADYYSVLLLNQYKVINCQLILECKPFGQLAAVDIAQATLYNCGDKVRFEYYNTGDDGETLSYGTIWLAQTFTPAAGHTITDVKLLLYKGNLPGTITVSIRTTDVNGHPTGNDLCVGTTNGDTLPNGSPYEWRNVTFGGGYSLAAGTKYAIVIRAISGNGSNYVNWRLDSTSPAYTGGCLELSSNSGNSWTSYPSEFDFMFEEWGGTNYQDITTAEAFGDVPAKMYIKIAPTGTTGTKTLWVAKRSGFRRGDTLWKEGESETSLTNVTKANISSIFYNPSDDAEKAIYGSYWEGQSFTTAGAITAVGVVVKLRRVGTLTGVALTAALQTTSGGYPTGTTLAYGIIFVASLETSATWKTITFYTPVALSAATQYALIVYEQTAIADVSNYIGWRQLTAGAFANGQGMYSINSGVAWTLQTYDHSFSILVAGDAAVSDVANAAYSAGNYGRVTILNGGDIPAATALSYVQYDIATPPRGSFRVLARVKGSTGTGVYTSLSFGVGYAYGGVTYSPSAAKGEYYPLSAGSDTPQILDLGLVSIPPIAESDIAANSTFSLRIYEYVNTLIAGAVPDNTVYFDCDYIFLLPVDEGVVILTSGAADIIALDAISERPNVFVIDSSGNITGYPVKLGAPFNLGRESTRIYVLRDDAITATFALDVKYIPQMQKI